MNICKNFECGSRVIKGFFTPRNIFSSGNLEILSKVKGDYYAAGDVILRGNVNKGASVHAKGNIFADANTVVNGNLLSENGEISIFGRVLKDGFAKAKKIITGGNSNVAGTLEAEDKIMLFGKAKGNIKSKNISVYGTIEGITQANKIEVKDDGKLGGTVIAKKLIVGEDGKFLENLRAYVDYCISIYSEKTKKGILRIAKGTVLPEKTN